jgi:protein arginine N-methyltransferase 2
MGYLDKQLTFQASKIFFPDNTSRTGEKAVMMDWEDPIMYASAQYVAENGGNILEIGFGLGISANHIQSYSPTSHTIIEIHPDIATIAKSWAEGKSGVHILEGDWYNIREQIQANAPYDGIFYDAYGDSNIKHLIEFCTLIINPGGRFTLWNPLPYPLGNEDRIRNSQVTYSVIDLSGIQIPENDYFTFTEYYLPKIQF